jgi:uncharacterized phiE125 gp8 family phage protein
LINCWQFTPVDLGETELVPLAMCKRHARIPSSDTDDDSLLSEILIPAAIDTVERDTRWVVTPREYSIELYKNSTCIQLPAGPFVSASLFAIDTVGDETELDDAEIIHDDGHPGLLTWDAVDENQARLKLVVRIGPTAPAPKIKLMIMTLVAHWYEHREAATADGSFSETPLGYQHAVKAMDPMTDAFRIAGACDAGR